MLHEPATDSGPDHASGYKSRIGLYMFALYSLIYAGFVVINVTKPVLMEMRWKGSNFSAYPVDKLIKAVKYPLFGSVYITMSNIDRP